MTPPPPSPLPSPPPPPPSSPPSRRSPFTARPLLPAIGALLLAGAACGAAHAVRGADVPPPTAEAVRAANPAAAGRAAREQAADAALALREGRITAVDPAAGQVEIDGTAFRLVDGRSRIYRRGALLSASALSRGQQVAFAVATPSTDAAVASAADRDTIAVIHVR